MAGNVARVRVRRFRKLILLLAVGSACAAAGRTVLGRQSLDPLLSTMRGELQRAFTALAKADPRPYYISYLAYDQDTTTLGATLGAMMDSRTNRARSVDITVRVGEAALDSTHGMPFSSLQSDLLPVNDDRDAIARTLWQLTDSTYKRAAAAYVDLKARLAVRAEEDDKSPDFSHEPAHVHTDAQTAAPPVLDLKSWADRMRHYSAAFRKYPELYSSSVLFQLDRIRSSFVSSEGTAVTQPSALARIIIQAATRADDGMELARGEVLQAPSPERLPAEAEIYARVDKIAMDLKALRAAPVAEPFDGPALLSGSAAAVFFHEVIGHRLEGHRQKDEQEGQTFTKKVNQQIMPEFLSIVCDPSLKELNGTPLTGGYDYDTEGIPGSRVGLVENGVLKNFLMSRLPIRNFANSNGHGRAQPGRMPTARQSNLIVTFTKAVSDAELRLRLIDEAKKQGKPYGLYFEDVLGGFTFTQRSLPQSFQLLPVMVWRIYTDGRPDELIRGVDIVGTPLAVLRNIMLTGSRMSVFNGVCGAESGQVPVSAAAPAMLLSSIEVQKRAQAHMRPPILPPPDFDSSIEPHAARNAVREVKP